MKIFSVYDEKAEAFINPLFTHTTGLAIRGFTEAANDPQNNLAKHPGDFTLFEIGTWDEGKGVVTMLDAKISLGTALQYVSKEE